MKRHMGSPAVRASGPVSAGDAGIRSALARTIRRFLAGTGAVAGGAPDGQDAAADPEPANSRKPCCASSCCA